MAAILAVLPCGVHNQRFAKLSYHATMLPNQYRTRNGRIEKQPPNSSGGNKGRGRPRARASHPPRGPRPRTPRRQPDQAAQSQLDANNNAIQAQGPLVLEHAHAGTPKVTRIYNEVYEFTTASLAFVDHGGLATDDDTDTIALNLMDHMVKEENWNPALSRNTLSAACFFFASQLTGKQNSPQDVAASFEWGAEFYANAAMATMSASSGGLQSADVWTTRRRVIQSLKVRSEDVNSGYEILWKVKGGFDELVGGYKWDLKGLHIPLGVDATETMPSQGVTPLAKVHDLKPNSTEAMKSCHSIQGMPDPENSQAVSTSANASPKAEQSLHTAAEENGSKKVRPSIRKHEGSAILAEGKPVEIATSVAAVPGQIDGAASPKDSEKGKAGKDELDERDNTELQELDDVELDEFESSVADFEN